MPGLASPTDQTAASPLRGGFQMVP